MKISIITVTLNSEATIRDTLNSILSQTYKNIEHIIVDGGSTDSTLSIIRRYPNKNKRVIIRKNTNIYEAMNLGIKNSTGTFIAILNSDDIYQNNKTIENVVTFIKKNKNLKVFLGNLVYFNYNQYYKITRYYSTVNFKPWMLRFGLMPPHPSSFIHRDVYKKYGLYKENFTIASDFDLFLRLLYINKLQFKIINKTIVRMRTGGVSGKNIKSYLTINEEIKKSFINNKLSITYLHFFLRIPSKIKQLLIYNQKRLNQSFSICKPIFDKQYLFKNNFNIIDKIKNIPLDKNFILSGMNLAFLGYFGKGEVTTHKNLYHWPDGIFVRKFIDIKKIPGRLIIKSLKIPKEIKKILVLGNISEISKKFLKKKFNIPVKNINLPFAPIKEIIKKKVKLDNKTLVLITLPTPKQEQYAYALSRINKDYKIICIGASVAIASSEEKPVPAILSRYEFLWRLRSDTVRRTKRLLETYYYFNKMRLFSNLFKKTSFRKYINN